MINLLQTGPVAVAVASTGWDSYSSGTLTCSPTANVDHAVIAIGYTATAIIIKNSWGTSWGIGGFGYVSRDSSQNCKILDQAHIVVAGPASYENKLIVMAILLLAFMFMI